MKIRCIETLLLVATTTLFLGSTSLNANAKSINHHYKVVKSNKFSTTKYTTGYATGSDGAQAFKQAEFGNHAFRVPRGSSLKAKLVSKSFLKINYKGKTGYATTNAVSTYNTYRFIGGYASTLNPNDTKHILLEKGTKQSYKTFWQFKKGSNMDIWNYSKNRWIKE